jgi:hypothetical protein
MPDKLEVLVIRSLTESDLGFFDVLRANARSNQRAININSAIAQHLIDAELLPPDGAEVVCMCTYGHSISTAMRPLTKVHKNWRLGGPKLEGADFAELDSRDFALLRFVARKANQSLSLGLTFVSKVADPVIHAGVASMVERDLKDSMASYAKGSERYKALRPYCAADTDFLPRQVARHKRILHITPTASVARRSSPQLTVKKD